MSIKIKSTLFCLIYQEREQNIFKCETRNEAIMFINFEFQDALLNIKEECSFLLQEREYEYPGSFN